VRLTAALLTSVCVTVLAGLAAAIDFHGLRPGTALVALALGLAGGLAAWRATPASPAPPIRIWDWVMLVAFGLVSLRAFLWLIYYRGDDLCVLSPNNLGDMSLHLNFIRNFASGVPFWPQSTILSGVPLTYPLGIDFFNSLLEIRGWDTNRALIGVGLAGAALTAYTLWRWGGAFALAALLFNGGLAGFAFFKTGQLEDYQTELVWKNLFLAMFVTQRGLLYALPAGLFLVTGWREEFFRSGRPFAPRWLQVLLYASLPLFNVHTFLFLSLILLAIFIVRPAARRATTLIVACAFLPATILMLLVTGGFSGSGMIHWAPNWMIEKGGFTGLFWDFGATLPFILAAGIMLFKTGDVESRTFVWTSILILAICSVVAFAPWPWDNMKLIIWSWLLIAPYLYQQLIRPLPLPARASLLVLLFFSGFVSLCGGLDARHGYDIAKRTELDAWRDALKTVPITDRIACVPDYNHPVILLGRRVACGYDGHLFSHGLKYQDKMEVLKAALAGQMPWQKAAPLIGSQWLAIRKSDTTAARLPGPPIPAAAIGELYDLRPLIKPPSNNQAPQPAPLQSVGLPW